MRLTRLLIGLSFALTACEGSGFLEPDADPDEPTNLTYHIMPSGDPEVPLGVLLIWDAPSSGRATTFDVHGRNGGGAWGLRATTTSTTFHDAGVPQEEYYVSAHDQNGNEIGRTQSIRVSLNDRLPAPTGLRSITLNRAVQLVWNSNAVDASPNNFDSYRVYSTSYDASRGVCTANWVLEGTTVTDGFFAGNMTNGVTRCFAVSAVNLGGLESQWSDVRSDTPRSDGRNAFAYATAVKRDSSAFLFFDDPTKATGMVASSTRTDVDFTVERHTDGSLWFAPGRNVTMTLYSTSQVAELTSIDRAPASGFTTQTIEAVPGYGYVFRVTKADGVHYAALRVAYVAADYVVFDWSYQNAVGNSELNRIPTP
jgi:hypothetical protein